MDSHAFGVARGVGDAGLPRRCYGLKEMGTWSPMSLVWALELGLRTPTLLVWPLKLWLRTQTLLAWPFEFGMRTPTLFSFGPWTWGCGTSTPLVWPQVDGDTASHAFGMVP